MNEQREQGLVGGAYPHPAPAELGPTHPALDAVVSVVALVAVGCLAVATLVAVATALV